MRSAEDQIWSCSLPKAVFSVTWPVADSGWEVSVLAGRTRVGYSWADDPPHQPTGKEDERG